jgi:hypothetical protein
VLVTSFMAVLVPLMTMLVPLMTSLMAVLVPLVTSLMAVLVPLMTMLVPLMTSLMTVLGLLRARRWRGRRCGSSLLGLSIRHHQHRGSYCDAQRGQSKKRKRIPTREHFRFDIFTHANLLKLQCPTQLIKPQHQQSLVDLDQLAA